MICASAWARHRYTVKLRRGNVALGLGLGAKVLIGGSRRTITLQPLSVEGQIGINLALGVANLTLR